MKDNLFRLLLLIFPLGLWLRLPLNLLPLSLLDFLLVILLAINFWQKQYPRRVFFLLAVIFFFSWLLSWRLFWPPACFSFLYLLRFLVYLGFGASLQVISFKKTLKSNSWLYWFSLWPLIFALFQYGLVTDFRSWQVLGWDPHWGRLIGNWYDPGFLATFFLLAFLFWQWRAGGWRKWVLSLGFMLGLFLTYSRANWLLFLPVLLLAPWRRSLKILVIFALALGIFFSWGHYYSLGTKISRWVTIKARLVNSYQAWRLVKRHPFLGIGYNNLPRWRGTNVVVSHSWGGFENSFLLVLASGGIFGFLVFLLFWGDVYRRSNKPQRWLLFIFLSSGLFNNSLFYPLLLVAFWVFWQALVFFKDGR